MKRLRTSTLASVIFLFGSIAAEASFYTSPDQYYKSQSAIYALADGSQVTSVIEVSDGSQENLFTQVVNAAPYYARMLVAPSTGVLSASAISDDYGGGANASGSIRDNIYIKVPSGYSRNFVDIGLQTIVNGFLKASGVG